MEKRILVLLIILTALILPFSQSYVKDTNLYKIIRKKQKYLFSKKNYKNFEKNPFLIDFPKKKDITFKEYEEIQQKLQKIDISQLLDRLYSTYSFDGITFEDFKRRCTTGLTQKLINIEHGQFPIATLEKLGNGGEWCIVSCAPYDNI